jgi:subtilisin-like proprotein convertase family protein
MKNVMFNYSTNGINTLNISISARRSFIFMMALVSLMFPLIPARVNAATATFSGSNLWLFGGSYTAMIPVSGVTENIIDITVTFNDLNHTWVADLDFVLESPGGQRIVLMSDVQGNMDFSGTTLTFQDGPANNFAINNDATASVISGGNYHVFNNNAASTLGDEVSDHQINGTEQGSLGAAFVGLNGADVNGNWILHFSDDTGGLDNGDMAGWSITITSGTAPLPVNIELPPPPPTPLCSGVNFNEAAGLRAVAPLDSMEVNCRMLVEDGEYFYWNGGPLTQAANIGDQSILDKSVIQAVDVFSPVGRTQFEGDVVICLRGVGSLILLDASQAPRVPRVITAWTTPSYPGFTCGTLYAPGTLALVANLP